VITVESSVVIPRPLAEVEAFVSDVANDPKWNPEVLAAERAPISTSESTDFHVKLKPFMGMSACTMKVSRDPTAHVTRIAGSPVRWIQALATYSFETVEGGTRVTRHCDIKVLGLRRALEPMMRGPIAKKKDEMLEGLRAFFAARSSS
jgi:hypothetical protein